MVDGRKIKKPLNLLEKAYVSILLVIFGGIVLHAPLSVGFGTLLPDYGLLIKSWKEILLLVAGLLAVIILQRRQQTALLKEPLMMGVAIYGALHILTAALFAGSLTTESLLAGFAIDLRYVLFFALVYIAIRLFPLYRKIFIGVGIVGALVVTAFALLQVFVLPVDVLKYIGYNINTIVPYLTVDQNYDFIRINSTLRGPNPLGAYVVIVLALLATFWMYKKNIFAKRPMLITAVLLFGGLVALWASYSRSAMIAAVLAAVIIILAVYFKRHKRLIITAGIVIVILLTLGLAAGRDSSFVSNVLLHEDPGESNQVNSNDGHAESLQDGLARVAGQPLGAGVGSTGSASLHGDTPFIVENQYLFIAHEVGWLGVIIFMIIFVGVLRRLWKNRSDWLALGVFASGVGLAVVGLFLPVWVDDTVAIIWWGLAAIALATGGKRE
jgi:hypothetical protein